MTATRTQPLNSPPPGLTDIEAIRALYRLDPDVVHLNHGSYGAVPQFVVAERRRIEDRIDANSNRELRYLLESEFHTTRHTLAAFCGIDPGGLAMVENVTTGASAVLESFPLRASDQVVVPDDLYPSVHMAVQRACSRADAELVSVPTPFLTPVNECVDRLLSKVGSRTRLVVTDHISTMSARVWPVHELGSTLADRGVAYLVDASHAPGPIEHPAKDLPCDFWIGSFHKWVGAPRGSAGLWVAPQWRSSMQSPVISHANGWNYPQLFDWSGTHDVTPALATPSAIAFLEWLGGSVLWQRSVSVARTANDFLHHRWGGRVLDPSPAIPMIVVEVPEAVVAPEQLGNAARWLSDVAKVEAVLFPMYGSGWARLSTPVYACEADIAKFAEALEAYPG
ncbi:aminotransferase class V-fold PLP-dependent enzyme [Nakamurella antarctica]|uniref:aminotransferase class V-fold PLP-dependent enzyme n=1 Tax=Nakamurella antarctica TaxID=1902245 RepID=UPI0013DE3051|nr:aminotransferase class V-fold PLP-dependent enzyme [Nakamurella antarctica]